MDYASKVQWLFLLVAGGVIHLFVDWFLQNHWQAVNKMKRYVRKQTTVITKRVDGEDVPWDYFETELPTRWWDRHPAAYAHAGLHALFLWIVFPFWAALLIGVLHLIIDTRSPLDWWGKFSRQTITKKPMGFIEADQFSSDPHKAFEYVPVMDIGQEVGIWRDQTAHIVVLALVALLCVL